MNRDEMTDTYSYSEKRSIKLVRNGLFTNILAHSDNACVCWFVEYAKHDSTTIPI